MTCWWMREGRDLKIPRLPLRPKNISIFDGTKKKRCWTRELNYRLAKIQWAKEKNKIQGN